MQKQQELEMWFDVGLKLNSVPNEYRSQNYSAFMNEVEGKIYELVEDLELDHSDWKFDSYKNRTYK
jgi:hypothetical protein